MNDIMEPDAKKWSPEKNEKKHSTVDASKKERIMSNALIKLSILNGTKNVFIFGATKLKRQ